MPVKIACPKCQQRYQLPESALGKSVKCKSCGASFRTKAPTTAKPQTPAKPRQKTASQPSRDELAQFGIDGQLNRQADIFDGADADPRSARGLGNHAAEDPGFTSAAKPKTADSVNPYAAPVDDGMSAVLANPVLMEGRGATRKSKSKTDLGAYKTARTGLSVVYGSWCILGLIFLGTFALGFIGAFIPSLPEMFSEGGSMETVGGVMQKVLGVINLLAALGIFIGQCMCIGTPEPEEKKFAALSVGAYVVSGFMFIAAILMVGVGFMSAFSQTAEGAEAAEGPAAGMSALMIVGLILILLAFLIQFTNQLFFAKFMGEIGRSLNSKTVQKSEKKVVKLWFWTIGLTVGGFLIIISIQFILALVGATTLAALLSMGIALLAIAGGIVFMVMFFNLVTLVEKTLKVLKAKG